YFDFRNDTPAAGLSTDVWIVHAQPRDGLTNPASWHDEERLTSTSFNLEQAPVRFGEKFIGDYQGLAAAGNSFYALWAQPHGSDPASIFFHDPAAETGPHHDPIASALDSVVRNSPAPFNALAALDPGVLVVQWGTGMLSLPDRPPRGESRHIPLPQ